jgi:hypothetical protein
MDCTHEGSPTFQVMRAWRAEDGSEGGVEQVTACSQCQTSADLDVATYNEAKEALPEGYGNDQGMGGTDA